MPEIMMIEGLDDMDFYQEEGEVWPIVDKVRLPAVMPPVPRRRPVVVTKPPRVRPGVPARRLLPGQREAAREHAVVRAVATDHAVQAKAKARKAKQLITQIGRTRRRMIAAGQAVPRRLDESRGPLRNMARELVTVLTNYSMDVDRAHKSAAAAGMHARAAKEKDPKVRVHVETAARKVEKAVAREHPVVAAKVEAVRARPVVAARPARERPVVAARQVRERPIVAAKPVAERRRPVVSVSGLNEIYMDTWGRPLPGYAPDDAAQTQFIMREIENQNNFGDLGVSLAISDSFGSWAKNVADKAVGGATAAASSAVDDLWKDSKAAVGGFVAEQTESVKREVARIIPGLTARVSKTISQGISMATASIGAKAETSQLGTTMSDAEAEAEAARPFGIPWLGLVGIVGGAALVIYFATKTVRA